jgi:hypothetical protein
MSLAEQLREIRFTKPYKPCRQKYCFMITEQFNGAKPDGSDLVVNYNVFVPASEVSFTKDGSSYTLNATPNAFCGYEDKARKTGANEIRVYPRFGN